MVSGDFKNLLIEMGKRYKYSIDKIIEPLMRSIGITKIQAMILLGICMKETSNVSAVSRLYDIGQANASTICKKMEQNGLIIRTRNKDDERIVSLSVTDKGLGVVRQLDGILEQFDGYFKTIPQEKLDIICNGMRELDNVFEALYEKLNTD